jgi:uncharacterized paraquat-inducible protein A
MTQAYETIPNPPHEAKLLKCDLCGNEFSYDPNEVVTVNTASSRCPRCLYNQTTVTKPRLKDIVAFATPVIVVYALTVAILLLNK